MATGIINRNMNYPAIGAKKAVQPVVDKFGKPAIKAPQSQPIGRAGYVAQPPGASTGKPASIQNQAAQVSAAAGAKPERRISPIETIKTKIPSDSQAAPEKQAGYVLQPPVPLPRTVENAFSSLPGSSAGKFSQPTASPGNGTMTIQPAAPSIPANTQQPTAETPAAAAEPIPPAAPVLAPERTTVDPATDTVQGQVEGIIAKDSPLMQLAGTRAKQAANSRGLLNSSMAVQAGEAAVIDAAMPMATQDANTFTRNKELNQAAENTFRLETGLQGLRGEQANQLAKLENDNRILMQTSQSAAQAMSTTNAAIGEILANPDIPANQKDALVARQVDMLKNNMAVIGSIGNLDLKSLLTFSKSSKLTPIPGDTSKDWKKEEDDDLWGKVHGSKNTKGDSTVKKILDPGGWF